MLAWTNESPNGDGGGSLPLDDIVFEYCMSVIVPMYNSQEFLRRSVASLDAQTAGDRASFDSGTFMQV